MYKQAAVLYGAGNKAGGDAMAALGDHIKNKSLTPERTLMQTPSGQVIEVHGGDTPPPGSKPLNQNPNIGPGAGVNYAVPDPNNPGGFINKLVKDGDPIPPGSRVAGQVGPTTATRRQSEAAQLVGPQLDRLIQRVDESRDVLGPAIGKANGFFVGKLGLEGSKYAGLDQDIMMGATASLLPHFQGRIPVTVNEDMQKHLSEAQTPDDLIARLESLHTWMDAYATGAGLNGYKTTHSLVTPGNNPKQATIDIINRYKNDPKNWTNGKPDRKKVSDALTKDNYAGF
jgi:hypothetical protein